MFYVNRKLPITLANFYSFDFTDKGPKIFAQFLIPGKFRALKTILKQIDVLLVVHELRPPGGSLWGVGTILYSF